MDSRPIGVFDSGVGGLTVARAIIDQLPDESVLYIGDSANTPYGPKPIARVRELALGIMDRLVQSDVKMLVIACISAAAAVLHDARERYQVGHGIPVVEVIQPAVRRAVAATRNGRIGVIGTEATIGSGAYDDAFAAAPHLELTTAACPAFVELVEKGITAGPQVQEVAERYLAPVRERGVDTLVLGCTHYPLLAGAISYTMGQSVTLVSSADETARDVYRRLAVGEAFAPPGCRPSRRFLTTGDPASFGELARRFLGPEVGSVHSTREISRSDLSCSDSGSHRQPDSVPSTQEMKR